MEKDLKDAKNLTRESQIIVSIGTLLESASDKDTTVRDAVEGALCRLAQKFPNEVVHTLHSFRERNKKLTNAHIALIMSVLQRVCSQRTQQLDGDSVLQAISLSISEMTHTVDPTLSIHDSCSGALVSLGECHCVQVMDGLLGQLQACAVPHYMIPHTMGSLASRNPFGTVPFIKPVLSLTLPVLGMVKTDHLRQAYAFAFGRFCEAITEYLSNISKAPDPTVNQESFTTELNIIFDILLVQWLPNREPKVSQDVLGALGPMFSLLPKEKITEHVPKLIPLLLGLYRRNIDKLFITQCLVIVLKVSMETEKNIFDLQVDNIFNVIFEQVSATPDYELPAKNHFEILRCFDLLVNNSADRIFELLIQQMKNNNEKERIRACLVIAHLTNSPENYIKNKLEGIKTILKLMMNMEQNPKMKIVLLKFVIAFAHRGFLADQDFIEFVVKHCCPPILSNKQMEDPVVMKDFDDLQKACNSSLFLITTNVVELENMLWPTLLQCLLNTNYTEAVHTLTKCLSHLAIKMQENSEFNVEKPPMTVPTEVSILSRCLALLGNPQDHGKGTTIIIFLKNYCTFINKQLVPLWEQKITALLWFLYKNKTDYNAIVWEEMVLDLLTSSIKDLDDVRFTEALSNKMMEQMSMYDKYIKEKGMLYKCLAVTVCHISDVQCVKQKIDSILNITSHNHLGEAQQCAEAIGICSRVHLDLVLSKLKVIEKDVTGKKSSKFFAFMKDLKYETEMEKSRYTLLLCLGQVALEAPSSKILPNLETEISSLVLQQLENAKEHLIKVAALETIGNIAEAMHPSRSGLHILLHKRTEIISQVLNQMHDHTNKEHLELFPVILKVTSRLVKLPPSLTSNERIPILSLIFDKTYIAACDLKTKFSTYEEEKANDHFAKHLNEAFNNLNSVVREMLLQEVSPANFDDIFALLEIHLKNKNVEMRLASMNTLHVLLQTYFNNMTLVYDAPSKFSQAGYILGRIAPRCTDTNSAVRQLAVEGFMLVLGISSRYEGQADSTVQEIVTELSAIKSEIETTDSKRLYHITVELANIISQRLPHFQLLNFTESVVEGLLDSENSSAIGSSVMLSVFLKNKGAELYHNTPTIVELCIHVVSISHCSKAKVGGVKAIIALAKHNAKAVTMVMLQQPLPFDNAVVECFFHWAQDPELAAETLNMLMKMLAGTNLHEETGNQSPNNNNKRAPVASLQPLAAVNVLSHMFQCAQMQPICQSHFHELFSLLLTLLAGYCGLAAPMHNQPNNNDKYGYVPNRNAYKILPPKMAAECFKNMLLCVALDQIAESIISYTGESLSSFLQTVPMLATSLVTSAPQYLNKVVESLNPYSQSTHVTQRLAAIAFFAELIPLTTDPTLLDILLTSLHGCSTDSSPIVRQCTLIGLSRVGVHERPPISRYTPAALASVIQGLDDEEKNSFTNIPLEAMRGISSLLKVASETQILEIQVTIAVRIRPYLENSESDVRVAAIKLFGDLSLPSVTDKKCAGFKEQVTANLACLLLHLSEVDSNVVKACKYTLKQVAPLLGASKMNAMIQSHLIDEATLQYDAFIIDLTRTLVDELPNTIGALAETAMPFLKSPWSEIRGNAALLIGLLHGLAIFPLPLDAACFRLAQLLEDPLASVRAKAATGLGALFGA